MKAMILAAGRGERMRPLTDICPKPLLSVGGKPLIVWQIEKLAQAGFDDIVINCAWLGQQIEKALGDGKRWGVNITYSPEHEPLETAGGIAQALPFLQNGGQDQVFLCVSADIFCDYDYKRLVPRIKALEARATAGMHMVMVPNPASNFKGDFVLGEADRLYLTGQPYFTFSNIGLYDTRTFHTIKRGTFVKMRPYYDAAIARGEVTGELFTGRWENVGTPEHLKALDAQVFRALSQAE